MSPVDTARQLLERWATGHRGLDLMHPDCVWDQSTTGWWDEQLYEGYEGVTRFLDTWIGSWKGFAVRPGEIADAGDGRVAIGFVQSGHFRDSVAPLEQHFGAVLTVEEGLIRRVQMYDRPEDAWQAVGLA
jgi:ketosteroid isomerase-like protein